MITKSEQLRFRRATVLSLASQGYSQRSISTIAKVSLSTVYADLSLIRKQSDERIRRYVDTELPFEFFKAINGLMIIQKRAFEMSRDKRLNPSARLHALSVAESAILKKVDLMTNSQNIDRALQFMERYKLELKRENDDDKVMLAIPQSQKKSKQLDDNDNDDVDDSS